MFCKIFGEGDSQILIIRSVNHEGVPILNLNFEDNVYVGDDSGAGLVCISHAFPTLEGAQAALESIDEEEARDAVDSWKKQLAQTLADEAKQLNQSH